MKKTLFPLMLFAALAVQGCNTSETHDRGHNTPAGTTEGPESGEDAREQAGDETNEAGEKAAGDYR